jgi:hypothetical protein
MKTHALLALFLCGFASSCGNSEETADPTDEPEWETLVGADWSLPPGTEGYVCVRKTLSEDLWVGAFGAVAPPGTHHTVLTYGPATEPDGVFECSTSINHDIMIPAPSATAADASRTFIASAGALLGPFACFFSAPSAGGDRRAPDGRSGRTTLASRAPRTSRRCPGTPPRGSGCTSDRGRPRRRARTGPRPPRRTPAARRARGPSSSRW